MRGNLRVIGLAGKAGSGKDYLARRVLRPVGFLPFSMAWHMKAFIVGTGRATLEEVFVTKPPSVRTLLQQEGTENGRLKYGEDVWCNTVVTWLGLFREHWGVDRIVIPDIRFPNEVAMVRNLGGKVVRVVAPSRSPAHKLSATQCVHASETALDNFTLDASVNNEPGQDARLQLLNVVLAWWPNDGWEGL